MLDPSFAFGFDELSFLLSQVVVADVQPKVDRLHDAIWNNAEFGHFKLDSELFDQVSENLHVDQVVRAATPDEDLLHLVVKVDHVVRRLALALIADQESVDLPVNVALVAEAEDQVFVPDEVRRLFVTTAVRCLLNLFDFLIDEGFNELELLL